MCTWVVCIHSCMRARAELAFEKVHAQDCEHKEDHQAHQHDLHGMPCDAETRRASHRQYLLEPSRTELFSFFSPNIFAAHASCMYA